MKLVAKDSGDLEAFEQMSDAEIAGLVRDGIKRFRSARDGSPGNVASSKEIELSDHTADDDVPTEGTPVKRADGTVAKDAALEELGIRQRAGYNMDGELHLARIKRGGSTAASVRAMDAAVPGYQRLK